MSGYRDCHDCKRPMRTCRQTLADHPGTVTHSAHGYCITCYKRRKKAAGQVYKQPRTDIDVTATMASLMAYHQWRAPYRAKAMQ